MMVKRGVIRRFGAKDILAAAIIMAQLVGIVRGRFSHESFWSWVPHDRVLTYRMEVKIGRHVLTPSEIRQRYGVYQQGLRGDYLEDFTHIIRLREERRPHDRFRGSV